MKAKSSKKVLLTTVFAAIIVLFAFTAMCTSVSAGPGPIANFTGTPRSGPQPLTVVFNDTSIPDAGIISWEWDFGDGGNSTAKNPIHVYTEAGNYNVTLKVCEVVKGVVECDTETKMDYITVTAISPGISIEKTASPTTIQSGAEVTYTYIIRNSGDCGLASIMVTDDKGITPAYVSGDGNGNAVLDVGETWTYEATANPTADVTNTGTAQGTDPLGETVSDSDTATVDVVSPGISIEKTASPTTIRSGAEVTYTYIIRNSGDCGLASITVTDDKGITPAYVSGDGNGNAVLDVGETWTYQATANPTADVTNTGTAQGTDPFGGTVSDSDTAAVDVISPGISIEKAASPTTIQSGDEVTYTYIIRNSGDCGLASITVTDDKGITPAYVSGDGNGNAVLDVGETWTYQATANPTAGVTNTGTAQGTDPLGETVSDSDTATVDVISPGIHVEKIASPAEGIPCTDVEFTIIVINTGDCTLDPVSVVDTLPAGMSYVSDDSSGSVSGKQITWATSLGAGASQTIQLVAHIDIGATGILTNDVTATGTPPAGDDITATATADVTGIDPWKEINEGLDELIAEVNAASMPNILKHRLIGKLEYVKKLKESAKMAYEAGNNKRVKKCLRVAKNQVESFASMLEMTRRIKPADKDSFLADSAEIKGRIDELIENIFIANMSKDLPLVNNVPIKETKERLTLSISPQLTRI